MKRTAAIILLIGWCLACAYYLGFNFWSILALFIFILNVGASER